MRIISGKFKGKKILSDTKSKELRPTTDFNRENLFNILLSQKFAEKFNFDLKDSTIIDLCCGTGAVGFEFLSRGAKKVTFVDNNFRHLEIVKINAQNLGLVNEVRFTEMDAKNSKIFSKFIGKQNDVNAIFIDPPYNENYEAIFENIKNSKASFLEDLLIIVEFTSGSKVSDYFADNFDIVEIKKYSKTSFAFLTKMKVLKHEES